MLLNVFWTIFETSEQNSFIKVVLGFETTGSMQDQSFSSKLNQQIFSNQSVKVNLKVQILTESLTTQIDFLLLKMKDANPFADNKII